MSTRPIPPLKCLPATPTGPHPAEPAPATPGGGAAKGVAEGVPSSVRSDPQTGDGRFPVAWLTISAPRGAVPTATSTCECGRNLFAAGHRKALALIDDHTRHRDTCPLRITEERNVS
ncbi:hypothetical protein CP967_08375 [Streptomyces nitrosporeus]|uniref:Uncharacterized protein n=1 Tax=Streptomyces nitrosporeus TaxID=28894 RepID=A0A5J6F6J5_9ACTN|nr:hypothetical protein [Streptomyces nitrosporeus]QEU71981.1 hypothetical protein CP967_08375 [Streptomyces nitrosporeus]